MTEPAATPPPGCPAHAGATPLYGPRFQTDPAQLYRELRAAHGPVAPVELAGGVPAWLVIGYRELQQVTGQPQLFGRDSSRWHAWDTLPADWPLKPMMAPVPSMLYTEGEEHVRRSRAVTDALAGIDLQQAATTDVEDAVGHLPGTTLAAAGLQEQAGAGTLAQFAVGRPLLV